MKKHVLKLVLLFLICAPVTQVLAVEYEGINFPDTLTLEGTNTELQLNGVGMRTKFFFDIYIGALYTQKSVNSRKAAQALSGPKRLKMHFLYSEVSKEKLVAGWNEGFENNNSSERLEGFKDEIEQFNAMFSTLVEGDVVLLDYIPGKGTKVTIKGDNKGVIGKVGFYTALLDIWLGDEPADDDLKEALLAQ